MPGDPIWSADARSSSQGMSSTCTPISRHTFMDSGSCVNALMFRGSRHRVSRRLASHSPEHGAISHRHHGKIVRARPVRASNAPARDASGGYGDRGRPCPAALGRDGGPHADLGGRRGDMDRGTPTRPPPRTLIPASATSSTMSPAGPAAVSPMAGSRWAPGTGGREPRSIAPFDKFVGDEVVGLFIPA